MILNVKPISSLPRAGIVIFAIALAGCGQKGPLYMPKPVPVPTANPTAAPSAATPANKPADERDAAPESK